MNKFLKVWTPVVTLTLVMVFSAHAQDITINRDGPADAFKGPSYSPYVGGDGPPVERLRGVVQPDVEEMVWMMLDSPY